MEATNNGMGASRDSRGLLRGLVNAVGFTRMSRNDNRNPSRGSARHASWMGPTKTESDFLVHLEQFKSRALYYNAHIQVR